MDTNPASPVELLPYQLLWLDRKNDPATQRTRFILKSRMIGATYLFAYEALDDANTSGDNQVFFSESLAENEYLAELVIMFADRYQIPITVGEGLTLANGARIAFVDSTTKTLPQIDAHVYLNEPFWFSNFYRMWRRAKNITALGNRRRTLFGSLPENPGDPLGLWRGDDYNQYRAESKQAEFDLTHARLKNGHLGADNIWRHMVTVEDAIAQGCNCFDLDDLVDNLGQAAFNRMFMCSTD